MIAYLATILQSVGSPHILVVGDLILDRYTWGDVERVSPEAPVLVLDADSQEVRLGGAASVAALLRGLDVPVTLAGVLGDDPAAGVVRDLLDEVHVDHGLTLSNAGRPTTTKERFVGRAASRHPHHILRVDHETREPLSPEWSERLVRSILDRLAEHQALLISDYHKGVCTPQLLATVIAAARSRGLPVLVDPARIPDYSRYRGATLLAPNRTEAALASGRPIRRPDDALDAGRRLCQTCGVEAAVVKLDSDGMVVTYANGSGQHVPTRSRPVHDVTGAGDMVLGVLGLCQAAGVPLVESVRLANVAAGLEVERFGVAPVRRDEILAELGIAESVRGGLSQFSSDENGTVPLRSAHLPKRVTLDDLVKLAQAYRRTGETMVFTNGCFDLLHVGHVAYLEQASKLGDVLVVAVNSDRSVRAIKGPHRPILSQDDRAAMLAALECVDHVLIFDDETPRELLRCLHPDVLVKGGTYRREDVIGREVVESYGGRVAVTGSTPSVSTTAIVDAILARQAY